MAALGCSPGRGTSGRETLGVRTTSNSFSQKVGRKGRRTPRLPAEVPAREAGSPWGRCVWSAGGRALRGEAGGHPGGAHLRSRGSSAAWQGDGRAQGLWAQAQEGRWGGR